MSVSAKFAKLRASFLLRHARTRNINTLGAARQYVSVTRLFQKEKVAGLISNLERAKYAAKLRVENMAMTNAVIP